MSKKGIDWDAVRTARQQLDEIKEAHPELVGPGDVGRWEAILVVDDAVTETQQAAFRLPVDLIKRLDRHVKRLLEASPGLNVTRADVVRMLLTKGLDEAEERAKRTAKR